MRNKELVQKINFNLSGINLNGILVAGEESDKAIKNLLELRSQVTEIIDLLESMKPKEEKPFTDVIPIPSNDFSLAQRVEQYKNEKEEVLDNSVNEQAGIKRSRYFAEGSGKKQPHSKSCFYSLNGEYSAKLISVKNLLSFSERVSQDMLKIDHVLETKVFKESNTEYILLSVFCNLMNTDYSTVSKYAEGDSDKFAIALFENETGRESARKLIELNYALGVIKQYGFKIKVKNVEFEGYLNLKYLLDLSTAISRRSLKDHYFEGKPLLAYIMNNSRYPWYYLNYNNTSIKESWNTYENYANTGDCNFDTKKRLFNDFLEVGFSSFENRFSRPVRQDVDFCRSAITVYDEATDNYYAVFGTRKEFAVMLIEHTDNRLDKIIEASYMLRDKIYTVDELAELCDRKQDWVVKAINHLGLDPEFINKETARDVMQLSTKSIVTAAYNEEK